MKLFRPIFWEKKTIISYLLFPLSLITLLINQIKKLLPKKKFNIKTICIGNIYIGGTGKTSLAIEIYKILSKRYKTTFIKKEYQNQIDELRQLKKKGKVISHRERKKALVIAQKRKFKLAILDDGLQQKNIQYDLRIVCFNSKKGVGNNFVIPSGPLREKINEIQNYDIIFINGESISLDLKKKIYPFKKKTHFFTAKYKPTNLKNFNLNKKYLMFSGIGNPHEFDQTLKKYRFKVSKKIFFPDHYKLNDIEIHKIKDTAKKDKLEIITTEKDFNRLEENQKKNIKFLKVKLKIKDSDQLEKIFLKRL